jgi:hypothetical protein
MNFLYFFSLIKLVFVAILFYLNQQLHSSKLKGVILFYLVLLKDFSSHHQHKKIHYLIYLIIYLNLLHCLIDLSSVYGFIGLEILLYA